MNGKVLINFYLLNQKATLAIRLWCAVDTTANESSLRRRTIQANACTHEKIIEFLSILHYNESLDISRGWALRPLQSGDNYLPELNLWASQRAGERASLYWRLQRTRWWWRHLLLHPPTFICCLVSFVEDRTHKTPHYQIK